MKADGLRVVVIDRTGDVTADLFSESSVWTAAAEHPLARDANGSIIELSSDRVVDSEGHRQFLRLSQAESDLMSTYNLEKRALELTEALSKAPPLTELPC